MASSTPTAVTFATVQSDGNPAKYSALGNDLEPVGEIGLKDYLQLLSRRTNQHYKVNLAYSDLPQGYRVFVKTRAPGSEKNNDKYLYGCTSGTNFRSATTFVPHALALLTGTLDTCPCVLCGGEHRPGASKLVAPLNFLPGVVVTGQVPSATMPPTRPLPPFNSTSKAPLIEMDPHTLYETHCVSTITDTEGTPDIFAKCLENSDGQDYDANIEEPRSIDWLVEKDIAKEDLAKGMADYLHAIDLIGCQYQPRIGEIVLYATNFNQGQRLRYNNKTHSYDLYSDKHGWSVAKWEAAMVTELPLGEELEAVDIWSNQEFRAQMRVRRGVDKPTEQAENIVDRNGVEANYLLESVSEPGNNNKSKRTLSLDLERLYPMVYWNELLIGQEPKDCPATIRNALTTFASISLVNKFRFQRKTNVSRLYCNGMFLGPEFIKIGDVVRLWGPSYGKDDGKAINRCMKIKSIFLATRIDEEAQTSAVRVRGTVYTTDHTRAWPTPAGQGGKNGGKAIKITKGHDLEDFQHCGNWHVMHDPAVDYEVPFTKIAGRAMETAWLYRKFPWATTAVASNLGAHEIGLSSSVVDFGFGARSVISAQIFSIEYDTRKQDGARWFWADTRVEQLDLHTINGQDVGTKARYGENNPSTRGEQHLKGMLRATDARKKKPTPHVFSKPSPIPSAIQRLLHPSVHHLVSGANSSQGEARKPKINDPFVRYQGLYGEINDGFREASLRAAGFNINGFDPSNNILVDPPGNEGLFGAPDMDFPSHYAEIDDDLQIYSLDALGRMNREQQEAQAQAARDYDELMEKERQKKKARVGNSAQTQPSTAGNFGHAQPSPAGNGFQTQPSTAGNGFQAQTSSAGNGFQAQAQAQAPAAEQQNDNEQQNMAPGDNDD